MHQKSQPTIATPKNGKLPVLGKVYCPSCGNFMGLYRRQWQMLECSEHGKFLVSPKGDVTDDTHTPSGNSGEKHRSPGQKNKLQHTRS